MPNLQRVMIDDLIVGDRFMLDDGAGLSYIGDGRAITGDGSIMEFNSTRLVWIDADEDDIETKNHRRESARRKSSEMAVHGKDSVFTIEQIVGKRARRLKNK